MKTGARAWSRAAMAVATAALVQLAGCGSGKVPGQRTIHVEHDPLAIVRDQLDRYARGQAVDSEIELFSTWVEDVRRVDVEQATWIETGLAEIAAAPAKAPRVAKKLLAKLGK